MFTSLAGCSVVVTGASKGIGKGIASVFAQAGANVLIVSRDAAAGLATAKELAASGEVSAFAADVRDPDSCAAMAAAAVERHGGIDVVCANAGVFPEGRLADLTPTDIDDVLDTNLKGTMHTVRACLPALRASDRKSTR